MTCNAGPSTPELLEIALDPTALDEYARELERAAEVLEVRLKGRATAHSRSSDGAGVGSAASQLQAGEVSAFQVFYTLAGVGYCDTVLRGHTGTPHRLIRRSVLDPPPAAGSPGS